MFTRTAIFNSLPKWLRAIIIVFSIITMVYWLGYMIFNVLKAFRVLVAYMFEERNYWTFIICIFIIGISTLLLSQYVFNLDPFGKAIQWFKELIPSITIN